MIDIIGIVGGVIGITGVLGVSHKSLSNRISHIEDFTRQFPTESQMRDIMADKTEVYKIQLDNLASDIQELKEEIRNLTKLLQKR